MMTITFHSTDRPRRKWVQLQCEGCGHTIVCDDLREALNFIEDEDWLETEEDCVYVHDDEWPYYNEHFCCDDCCDPPEWGYVMDGR